MAKTSAQPAQPLLATARMREDWRCFKAGDEIELRAGVNLLVGGQGCGKSSFIKLLRDRSTDSYSAKDSAKLMDITVTRAARMAAFDFEHDNPRTLSYFVDDGMSFQIQSKFSSHGQTVLGLLRGMANIDAEPSVLVLDEPDMALSPRSARRLALMLDEIAAKGHQVIAAVHNPLVIASQAEVLSMEHGRQWMSSTGFLALHEDLDA